MGAFHFVVLAALRAAQLTRGCRPRIDELHVVAVTAQREIAEGKIALMAPSNGKESPIGGSEIV
jgi:DNA-directed RNA polymerase subunit K/omega